MEKSEVIGGRLGATAASAERLKLDIILGSGIVKIGC